MFPMAKKHIAAHLKALVREGVDPGHKWEDEQSSEECHEREIFVVTFVFLGLS
jgi:hypothetical protein